MFNKHQIFITIFGLLFIMVTTLTAQDKSSEKKADHSSIQEDMHKCMDKIASDEHMRGEMMTKMMDHMKGDSTSMMKMCKTMMDNPEMHSMMKNMMGKMNGKMMGGMNGKMMPDSTNKMNESTHKAHHQKNKDKNKL